MMATKVLSVSLGSKLPSCANLSCKGRGTKFAQYVLPEPKEVATQKAAFPVSTHFQPFAESGAMSASRQSASDPVADIQWPTC